MEKKEIFKLPFTKMEGCGNDYVYINCYGKSASVLEKIESIEELAIKLSDRHFGVGGDGVVLIMNSDIADARMRMFNLDGSEGKMCGNAIRCVAKYLYDNKLVEKKTITIETLSGIKTLYLTTENDKVVLVKVYMGAPIIVAKDVPVVADSEVVIDQPIEVGGKDYNITCVSMGNPHAVVFWNEDIIANASGNFDINTLGPKFENNAIFPERVNTEFVKVVDKNNVIMRVWERGSGETLACGTGACATVVACVLNGHCNKGEDVKVKLIGGELIINYQEDGVYMTGPCKIAFEGSIEI